MKSFCYKVYRTLTYHGDEGDLEFYFSRHAYDEMIRDCKLYDMGVSEFDTLCAYCTDFRIL